MPVTLGLNDFELLKGLDDQILDAIQAEMQVVHLTKGQVLLSQGGPGDSLFEVASGRLDVSIRYPDGSEISIDLKEAGSSIGEIAILTGQARTATVKALEDSTLYRISRSSFDRLSGLYPVLEHRLAKVMTDNINFLISVQVVRNLFGALEPVALKELEQNFTWKYLQSGEVLYSQGEAGDSMAIVIRGRLQVVIEKGGKSQVIAELRRGMITGEIGLLTGAARTATVYAIRDTDLIVLTRDRFEVLIQQYPHVMLEISRILAERLNHTSQMLAREHPQQISIAFIPGSSNTNISDLIDSINEILGGYGPALHLNSKRFAVLYPRHNAVSGESENLANPLIEAWLDEQDSHYSYLLFETDLTWTPWTARCIGHADTIYFVAFANEPVSFDSIEAHIRQTPSRANWELVLVHPNGLEFPQGTARWLQEHSYLQHHHIRLNNASDYRRLARRIARRSNGLVLGGGGARGFAHVGVYRALQEAGIEIDVLGGTSMGALASAAIDCFEDYQLLVDKAGMMGSSKRMMDYTIPLTALNTTRKITNALRSHFGEIQIEDLWRSYFCISTNLSTLQPVIHRSGPLWEAIRASTAIPGVFTPITRDGELLVDGGLVDNLPIDIMREACESGLVIAVNVAQAQAESRTWDFGPSISGWQILLDRLNPFVPPMQVPSISDILMRTIDMVTQNKLQETMQLADLIILPEVEHIHPLQWEAWRNGIDLGYLAAQQALEDWQPAFR